MCERVGRFLPAIFPVRQPLKTPPELVTLQLGEPNSETPTPASPPPRNRVIYAALGLPPGGDPLDFPDTPLALVVVDVAELAPFAIVKPGRDGQSLCSRTCKVALQMQSVREQRRDQMFPKLDPV